MYPNRGCFANGFSAPKRERFYIEGTKGTKREFFTTASRFAKASQDRVAGGGQRDFGGEVHHEIPSAAKPHPKFQPRESAWNANWKRVVTKSWVTKLFSTAGLQND